MHNETILNPVHISECVNCSHKPIITSIGVGDTIAKIIDNCGLGVLASLYTKITGKDCGCIERQQLLNKLIPYGIKQNL